MIYTQTDLLKLMNDTRALSIWDRTKGPVFWYTANVPGPFYVNTEMVIGNALSERLLREITAIVAGTVDTEARARQLNALILDNYKASPGWQRLIATLVAKAQNEFGLHSFAAVSGGERRDWLFSIPFAHVCDLPHLFLFKNQALYCDRHVSAGASVLHVSDLINNAASFFDRWLPIFEREKVVCAGNLCVNIRGDAGARRLREAGQKMASLVTIDNDFFRHLHAADLIDRATYEEITVFFASAQDWAAKYLIGNPGLFDVQGCDAKSFERLRAFIRTDPWHLRQRHEGFFATMQKAIDQRAAKAA
jgi:hypothetical protein